MDHHHLIERDASFISSLAAGGATFAAKGGKARPDFRRIDPDVDERLRAYLHRGLATETNLAHQPLSYNKISRGGK